MALLDKREVYSPFEYQEAYDFWLKQQQAHWMHNEIAMASDINDWKLNLSEKEKNLIGNILKGFVQSEILIANYWSHLITQWFQKPEICMAANCMANMETIHQVAYAYLNESLNLLDFDAFLYEPTIQAKLSKLVEPKSKSIEDIALSIAIFSGFAEGVQLFSSFAILLNFSRFNKLKGVGQIINFSVKDESLHSQFGCWLFNQLIKEYPHIWTDELKKKIYDAARLTVQLEDNFIDKAFELGNVDGLSKEEMKVFIRNRANIKLIDLGLKTNWKNLDKEMLKKMDWFDFMTTGVHQVDFFAARVTDYSKGVVDFDQIWGE